MSETTPHGEHVGQTPVGEQGPTPPLGEQGPTPPLGEHVGQTPVGEQGPTPVGEQGPTPPVGEPVDQLDGTAADQSGAAEEHVPAVSPSGTEAGLGDHATGDIVIDSALQDLQSASAEDLDTQIEAGRRVHQTLHARLSDLGGE